MAEISIIVPVYKVEHYLPRCVESILGQTYEDFELILVDDGSPDNCGRMCEEYALKDSRIHVIHRENGGLSIARNTGIDWSFSNSTSSWLTFIDSDDWVHPRYLEVLKAAADKFHTNISIGNALWTTGDPLPEAIDDEPALWKTEDYYSKDVVNATVAWGKLYKKSCFSRIRFPDGKIHEDEYVTYRILFTEDSLAVVDQPLYGYFQNDNGITRGKWNPKRMDAIEGLEGQIPFFLEKKLNEIAHTRFEVLLYVIVENMDRVQRCQDLSKKERRCYMALLRKKLRNCLIRYRKYGWVNFKKDRPVYASSSAFLSICRQVWLDKIKPFIRKA